MKHDNLDSIISKIFRGNAVLFVGAGFSKGAISFNGCMPVGDELKQKILSRMNKEGENVDLKTAADFFCR